jgi:FMN-dependent NADH-azoreductase
MIAGGGRYDKGTAMESINFAEPYLRHMLGFIGVTDVNFLTAGGTLSIRGDRETFLQPHIDAIRGKFAA